MILEKGKKKNKEEVARRNERKCQKNDIGGRKEEEWKRRQE